VDKKSRAEATLPHLQKLQNNIDIYKGELAHDFTILKSYKIVVISEIIARSTAESLNNFCRENKIGFIYCACLGLFVFSFTDFGENFLTMDVDGEESYQYKIKSISKQNPGIVKVEIPDRDKLRNSDAFSHGEFVSFKEISGMTELNESPPRPIRVISHDSFSIEDTSKFSDYIAGGIIERVKVPKPMLFRSLKENFENPYSGEFEFFSTMNSRTYMELSKASRFELLHLSLLSLHEYISRNNRLPHLNSKDDSKSLIEISQRIYSIAKDKKREWAINLTNIEQYVLVKVAELSRAQIPAVCSFLGGIVAQEVLKFSGKFLPFNQWFIFDFLDILNFNKIPLDEEKIAVAIDKKSKYMEHQAVFGKDLINMMKDLKIIIHGDGYVRRNIEEIFELMGVDLKMKTKLQNQNKNENEEIQSDVKELAIFANLNNEEQRNSLIFKNTNLNIPIFELHSHALKGISNLLTDDILISTSINCMVENLSKNLLKNFSSLFEESKTFSKNILKSLFISQINELNSLIFYQRTEEQEENEEEEDFIFNNLEKLINIEFKTGEKNSSNKNYKNTNTTNPAQKENFYPKIKNKLFFIKKLLEVINSKSFEKCIEIAIFKFLEIFDFKIKQLILKYPNENEFNLWHDAKRCPSPIDLNLENKTHFYFIKYYALILANCFNIDINIDSIEDMIISFADKSKIEEIKNWSVFSINEIINNQNVARPSLTNNKLNEYEHEKEVKALKEMIVILIQKIKSRDELNITTEKLKDADLLHEQMEKEINIFLKVTGEISCCLYKINEVRIF
jgi:ubiquitin-activating enzyme E1